MTDKFSLEEAMIALDEIVHRLEGGELALDEAMTLFEKGQALVKGCEADLDAKELRIRQITEGGEIAPLGE